MARIIGKGYSYDDVLITPKYNKIFSRSEVSFETKVTKNYSLKIPFIAANMDTICESEMAIAIGKLGGLGVIHRFLTIEQQALEVSKVRQENILASAAVGVKDYELRVPALVQAGVQIIVIDIAHGHSKRAGKTLDWIKANYPQIDVMAGNIATKDAAQYFLSKGADGIKVGIGPGSLCETRIMAGAGIPQITAIMDAHESTQGRVPICADGGIRYPGDVVKAIGAGADTVMIGSIISGTDETPGEIVLLDGEPHKEYRGMASYDATLKKQELDGKTDGKIISVEGQRMQVPCKGPVLPIIDKFLGGLSSGMTYVGAKTIPELKAKADFIEISFAGLVESRAHGLDK